MYPELFLTKIAQKIEEKTVKTLIKKSKFRRSLAFLGFWAPPPSSTPSCRCDLEARLRGHFLQRRPSTPRLGLRACIVSRFGCDSRNRGGDLGLGGWLVGETWDLGKKEGLDLPALCSDLSTIPQLGEQWQGEGKSWGWGRDQIGCLILVPISEVWTMSRTTSSPMTTNHIQLLSVRLTIHIWDEDQDGRAEKCPQERLHRLDGDHGFYWIVIKRKCGGGKKGRKSVRMFGRWILKLH